LLGKFGKRSILVPESTNNYPKNGLNPHTMKKVSILFALALILGVTACNPSEKKEEGADQEQHDGGTDSHDDSAEHGH